MSNSENPLEQKIENYLVKRAELCGGKAYKITVKGLRGFPDRVLCLPNAWIAFVEVKRPKGGRISEQQKMHAQKLSSLGFRVCFPKTYADVDLIFKTYERRQKRDVNTTTPDPEQTTTA